MSSGSTSNSSARPSGSNTPLMESSCEFVNIGEEEVQDARRNTAEDLNDDCESVESIPPVDDVTLSAEASKDEELRHLMGILQERVRSGSPSHSVVSTDSDFIHLREPEDLELSTPSSAGSRFNIIVNRDVNNLELSDREEEDPLEVMGEEVPPDADDRVESDIAAPQLSQVQEPIEDLTVVVPPVRHYIHSPNRHLNTLLTAISLTALGFAIGIAIGHGIGSSREAHLQQEIQEGQKLRLRSVQDDLLMCLRKQEDIDQTINKLNEIENILVDAEHWRNEYEELLNLKLQNEEKWRLERGELRTSLADVERSHDQLLHTKSCAHDNEYLSRQESTLKSVHEKLEGSLSDKDLQIEKLQTDVLELKVSLLSAEKMAEAYKRSNDDKSLLILELKEQLLTVERELFDLNINSEEQTEQQSLPAADSSVQTADYIAADFSVQTADYIAANPSVQQSAQTPAADTDTSAYVPRAPSDSQPTEDAVVVAEQKQGNVADREAVVLQVVSASSRAEDMSTESQGQAADTTSMAACQQAVQNYKQEIGQLQQEISTLQYQLRNHPGEQPTTQRTANEYNNTNSQCILLNLCDNLKINISRDELLQAYEATKGQYNSLQSFVLSQWRSLISGTLGNTSATDNSSQPVWTQYMSQTKSVVSDLLDTMNSSWQGFSSLSQKINDTKIGKKTQKIQAKLTNVAKIVSKGVKVVKDRLANVFDSKPLPSEPVAEQMMQEVIPSNVVHNTASDDDEQDSVLDDIAPEDIAPDLPKTVETVQLGSVSKNRKFQRRLSKLRKDLHKLNRAKVDKMRKYAKKKMYERLDDFRDDFSHALMNADLTLIRKWVDCQCSWWKREIVRESNDDYNLPMECADDLLPWQHPIGVKSGFKNPNADTVDGSWQFERAEMREYHREEPDDWYWRKSHDYETGSNIKTFSNDEL